MKNKKLVLYVALAVSLGACGNDNESESSPVPDGRTALTVQGKIRVKSTSESRAIDTGWGYNDKIGVFMVYSGNGAGLTQENICGGADNKCYVTTGGDGNFKPDGTETEGDNTNIIYFPVVGAVDFYAYYPFVSPADWIILIRWMWLFKVIRKLSTSCMPAKWKDAQRRTRK